MAEVKVENVSFFYNKDQFVLKDVELKINEGTTAIIGQNGAGKTTLVKLMKGLLKPVKGDLFINGKNTKEHTVAELASEIGFVFQNPNDQIFKHKVMDEIMFGPKNIGQTEKEAKENSFYAMEKLGIADVAEKNPYDLSLSDRKMVSIASVLAMKPPIVIFDEPTMGQDMIGKERLKKIIKDLKKDGTIVISIIHDMDFVAETFDRVVVMNKGKIMLNGTPREVFSDEDTIRNVYLELPHATKLGKELGLKETCLTVEELISVQRSTKHA